MVKVSAFPSLDGLVDLACRDGVDVRPTLFRVLTDLYVQKPRHSAEEEIQYVELALRLVEAVDAATRAIVAARLAAYPAAPAAVLNKLRAIDTSSSAGPSHRLAETRLPSGRELADLFFAAHSDERWLILTNLDAVNAPAAGRRTPVRADQLLRLEAAALARNSEEFARTLEGTLGIGRAVAERIVSDPTGEAVVVAAKALGMTGAMLQRILLFLNPAIGESVERVYKLARLFDELSDTAASRMVTIWRQAGAQRAAQHETFMWDDERRGARTMASPLPHRAVVRRDAPRPSVSKVNRRG